MFYYSDLNAKLSPLCLNSVTRVLVISGTANALNRESFEGWEHMWSTAILNSPPQNLKPRIYAAETPTSPAR